jgi:cytochrome c-type biogenesis protein CcmH/NrfG
MAPDQKRILTIAIVAVIAVAGSGGWLYSRLASRVPADTAAPPAMQSPHPAAGMPAPAAGGQGFPGVPTVEAAAEKLAKRLRENDGTSDDWALLARSYREMKRYPEALDAYDRAVKKAPDNTALAAEAADVRKNAAAAPR